MTTGPILAAIPLNYSDGDPFWGRDMGLIVSGLRTLGVDARLVALGRRENHPADLPLVLGTLDDFQDPDWWQKLHPSGIILNTWSAPRYDLIRKAALSATPCVVEKLDSDGVRAPEIWPWKFAFSIFGGCLDSGKFWQKALAPAIALLRLSLMAFPSLLYRRMALSMAQLPVHAAESPIAVARTQRFLRRFLNPIPKVVFIPHPVAEDYMKADQETPRENRIVSVGRWPAFQKNFPLLLETLQKFLALHPHWSADIVGELPRGWNADRVHPCVRERIRFHGRLPHKQISALYKTAKVFFMSSRYESFNIAAAEALCCGCSLVGSGEIASVSYFTSTNSGTSVCRQTSPHFLDALCAEAALWEEGARNPEEISRTWISRVGSKAVAQKVLDCLESIKG
ncbi:MAG: glycosyltransferase family 4 protein [Verrucomicrobia bacterium]|nr:glycosyltransferase family 4 protein [Verrucomicrobiota bacterium]